MSNNAKGVPEATPRPWKIGTSIGLIYGRMTNKYGVTESPAVAACSPEAAKNAAFIDSHYSDNPLYLKAVHEANAKLICEAVNSFDALQAANKELREALQSVADCGVNSCPQCAKILRQAIRGEK